MTTSDQARVAHDSHDWEGTLDALEGRSDLGSDELVLKADALYWTGRFAESLDAYEEAISSLVSDDRSGDAALLADLLAYLALRRQSFAVAGGWIARAEQLLEGQPEGPGHAWLKILYLGKALLVDGDIEASLRLADEANESSRSIGSLSGQSISMSFKAIAMIQSGDWQRGLELLDQSTVMAKGGEDLRLTSDVYCNTIASCRNLGDYRRAREWTDEAERWMRSNSVDGYTGACQVHRAELKRLHGSWLDAEDEARRACEELERFQLNDYLGSAHYEIGEIRRRMGDQEFAQEAFDKAYELGNDAQPGLSLLMMDRGETEQALDSITNALAGRDSDDEQSISRGPSRARLLPAQIEIALEADDLELAESSIEQLRLIADAYRSQVWQAAATSGQGALALARSDPTAAIESLGEGWRMWQQADLPYEMSKTRVLLGRARREAGDETGAKRELKAALTTFEELGAASEVRRVSKLLGDDGFEQARPSGRRVTRTFMFTDIVTSTDLIGLIGDESWEDLLKWHNKTLHSAINSAGGEMVRHTGDGFFASFADSRSGIDCAVDIQRRLANHRRESGFAPLVRIGLHRTEATRTGGDYSGGGIHLAARIGDVGEGEEIVVSTLTLDDAGRLPYPASEPTVVELKGISEPMQLHWIDWRTR